MAVQPVSPFNAYGFTTPAPKTQEIKPAVTQISKKPEKEKAGVVELPKKSDKNKKMSVSDKVMIAVSGLAFLTALGVMGGNGCFGKSIQKFLGGIGKVKPNESAAYTSLRIKNVLNSDKKTVINTLKNSKIPYVIEEADGLTYVMFDNTSKNRIVLAYEQGDNGILTFISTQNKNSVRTDMNIVNKKIDEARRYLDDYVVIKKYNIPERKGVETNIFTKEGELLYKKSPKKANGYYYSACSLPDSNITLRKNHRGKYNDYVKYYQDSEIKVNSSENEYNDALIDLALLTGVKNLT